MKWCFWLSGKKVPLMESGKCFTRYRMEEKSLLKKYFNRKSFGTFGPGKSALLGAWCIPLLLTSGSTPVLALGVVTSLFVAGQVNEWQKVATEKYIWKPRIIKSMGL